MKKALISFHLLKDTTFNFIIREDHPIPPIVQEVARGSSFWQVQALRLEDCLNWINPARAYRQENDLQFFYALGELLFQPIMKYLEGIDALYLVPHSFLHHLPLHALRIRDDHGTMCHLLERFVISYLPTASVLRFCQLKNPFRLGRQPITQSLILGNWEMEDEKNEIYIRSIHEEANSVSKLLGTSPLMGRYASKSKFLEQSGQADLIHLICHGYFFSSDHVMKTCGIHLSNGETIPNRIDASDLLVSQDPKALYEKRLFDSFVTAEEILALRLRCHLITLSACVTGKKAVRQGDEILGMLRALIYAGAPSILISLWQAFAPSKKIFMSKFYHNWLTDRTQGKAIALQKTQLEVMKIPEFGSLYHWGGYYLVGDML